MDQSVLTPILHLAPAFAALKFIQTFVEQVETSKRQVAVLAQLIAQLLQTLDKEYCEGQLLQDATSVPLDNLSMFVNSVGNRLPYIHTSHMQVAGRYFSVRAKGSVNVVAKATAHQKQKNCTNLQLLPTY